MLHKLPKVSVIFPTLNEEQNLPLIFPHIPFDLVSEVIIVDGRSADRTVEVAQRLLPTVKVVLEKTPGKGAALRAGYKAASGDILIVIDADGSNDPREIPRYVRALLEGADFVKGSRFAHNGGTTDMPRYRKAGNGAFVQLVNLLFDTSFTDLCYGYHAFWRYCLELIDLNNVDGFEIDTALYIRAVRERLRISEVASFEGYRFYGIGKLQTIPDGWRVLYTIGREWLAHTSTRKKADYLGFRGPLRSSLEGAYYSSIPAFESTLRQGLPLGSPQNQIGARSAETAPYRPQANFDVLRTIIGMLTAAGDLNELLHQILFLTLEGIGGSSASLFVLNNEGSFTEGCYLFNGKAHTLPRQELAEVVEQGLVGWVIKHRQPALVTSTRDDPRWYRRTWEQENDGFSRSAIGFPLMVNESVIGVLTIIRPEPEQFSEADLGVVTQLAATTPVQPRSGIEPVILPPVPSPEVAKLPTENA